MSLWPPKPPPSAPTRPDRRRRTVRHVPGQRSRRKNPFHPKKESAAATETPTQARARRARTQREREPSLTTKQYTAAQSPAPGAAPTTKGSQYGRGARTSPETTAAAAQHGLGQFRRIDPPLHDGFGGEFSVQRRWTAADERARVRYTASDATLTSFIRLVSMRDGAGSSFFRF